MEQQTSMTQDYYTLEQYRLDCVALCRELGLTSSRMTEEQQKIYVDAKEKLWREKCNWPKPPDNRRQAEQTEPQS
jgi:hypothetical protein